MALARNYLLFYNTAQCLGWSWVLQRLLSSLIFSKDTYESVRVPLVLFQSLALLEVFHSLTGLVRASFQTTLLQLSSRLFLTWPIMECIPEVRSILAFKLMVAAWSLTEVPRYFFFAYSAQVKPPAWLVWVRYSTFFPLYPLGASSEFLCVYHALPYILERGTFNVAMPNAFNFAFNFYYFCIWTLAMYVPGLAFMYFHMIHQRSKNLSKLKKAAKSE